MNTKWDDIEKEKTEKIKANLREMLALVTFTRDHLVKEHEKTITIITSTKMLLGDLYHQESSTLASINGAKELMEEINKLIKDLTR